MSSLAADRHARQRALETDRSFCVLAPAGSGKTELLTQRLLKLLSLCERPEQILAITFTRKAAGEMRHRLLDNLRKAELAEPLTDTSDHAQLTRELALAVLQRDAAQGWRLLQQPNQLRIVTIDSFTSYLTTRLPLAAGFGAQPELTTEVDALFRQAVRGTLARLDDNGIAAAPIARLLPHLHNNLQRAETLLLDLLKRRADWLPQLVRLAHDPAAQRPWLEQCMRDVLIDQLQTTRAQLLPYQAAAMELAGYAWRNLADAGNDSVAGFGDAALLPPAATAAVAAWEALAALFLTDKGSFRKTVTNKQGFPGKSDFKDKTRAAHADGMKTAFKSLIEEMSAAGLLPAWQALQGLPPAQYRDDSWPVLAALLNVLPVLAAELQLAMQSAGLIDHVETSLAALQALGSDEQPTDLALRLDYKLQHILVDEFQDTSHTQFALLEKLSAGWQPGDGRTLFIVGDGMQSCYGFRNADVSLFLRARDAGIGTVTLEPLQLSANFRSAAPVVDWVNVAFAAAFPASDDLLRGGVRYTPSVAAKPSTADAGVECLLQVIAEPDDSDDDDQPDARSQHQHSRVREAELVASRCAELRADYPAASIAILVRNRKHLALVVPALRRRNLQWTATDIDHLLAYQELADLHTLLRALLNPADVTALYALLRSPLIGLALHDLDALATCCRQQNATLWQLLPAHTTLPLTTEAKARLARTLPILLTARQQRQRQPLRSLLELCWLELGGAGTVQDVAVLPNIARYFDLVEVHTGFDDIADLHAFEQTLEQSFGSAASDPNLHLMTIHKAKGLQFDHVLLCGLDRRPRGDDAPLIRWQQVTQSHGNSRLLLALKPQLGGSDEPLYDFLAAEQKQRNQYELTRLLYIGVTRAIKTARLYGTVSADSDGGYKTGSGTLLSNVLPVLVQQSAALCVRFEPVATVGNRNGTSTPDRSQQVPRLPANWTSPLPAPLLQALPALTDEPEPDTDNLLQRRFGELVHLGLKQLVQQGHGWLARSADLPLWRAQLAPLCAPAELNQWLQLLQLHLQSCERSETGRWLFLQPHASDACELGLQDYRSGWRNYFVVDRTFVTAEGERWIVDYKTATPAAGQSVENFLAQQAERYRPQLTTYRELLAVADPSTAGRCRVALYFTGLDRLHELV
ncbi:MAG TPA: UvrD-helicase domain-containing protein [Candidatus Acidoferrum sp.]|nr:UvrD-helicase domain-containing protein [Candidatus Acidoferrum sp.]